MTTRNTTSKASTKEPSSIGRLGGQRVRELIAAGRKAMERPVRRRHT